jgi:hypothetical protein
VFFSTGNLYKHYKNQHSHPPEKICKSPRAPMDAVTTRAKRLALTAKGNYRIKRMEGTLSRQNGLYKNY